MDENDDSDSDSEEEPVYTGKRSADGSPHGRGTLQWPRSLNRFEGHFVNGDKHGRGCFRFFDGSSLAGGFKNDCLEGLGVYTYPDGRYLEAQYVEGLRTGNTWSVPEGDVIARGRHRNDVRVEWLQLFDAFNGCLIGKVDEEGELTGDGILYVYPDGKTALIGEFQGGILVKARAAVLETDIDIVPPKFKLRTDHPTEIKLSCADRQTIAKQPLIPDHYERDRVYVAPSLITDAGEGLFARIDLSEGEIASFYNGIRISHQEVDSRKWALNGNTISLDENIVIDVPEEYSTTDAYCATLGHKVNHSTNPNCKYDPFVHPRFGNIKCIRTLHPITAEEELTCDYGYEHKIPGTSISDLPSWFEENRPRTNGRRNIPETEDK